MDLPAGSNLLRGLLGDPSDSSTDWVPRDLGLILDHQMATALLTDTVERNAGPGPRERDRCRCASYGQLFNCTARPCAEVTRAAKDHFKGLIDKNADFPVEVAKILYLLTLIRAKRMELSGVSNLSEATLTHLIRRALTHGWISEPVRTLLRQMSSRPGSIA